MCGRFTLIADRKTIVDDLSVDDWDIDEPVEARFNVAPTLDCPVIVLDGGRRKARAMRWGLVPHWADDPKIGSRMINARAETLLEKRSFSSLLATRRCLIPASGFYEWKARGKVKQPYYVHPSAGPLFAFAGLWTRWRKREGEPLESFTIVTTSPQPALAWLHDRMPAVLGGSDRESWLDGASLPPEAAVELVSRTPGAMLEVHAVSRAVNDVRRDGPELIEPITLEDPP